MMCDLKMFVFRSNYEQHKASGSNIFVFHSGVLKITVKEKDPVCRYGRLSPCNLMIQWGFLGASKQCCLRHNADETAMSCPDGS